MQDWRPIAEMRAVRYGTVADLKMRSATPIALCMVSARLRIIPTEAICGRSATRQNRKGRGLVS